jgi:hypothetical protein
MALRSAIEEVDTTVAVLKEQRDARRQTPTTTPQKALLTLANAVDEHRLANATQIQAPTVAIDLAIEGRISVGGRG